MGAGVRTADARLAAVGVAALAAVFVMALRGAPELGPSLIPDRPGEAGVEGSYGEMPLAFEPNAGRTASQVDYIARAGGSTHFLTSRGATIALRGGALRIGLVGAAPVRPRALSRLPGVVNSLIGDDRSRWRTGIPTFERVRYSEVWPGIAVEWYGNRRRLEYDFVLAPRADPGRIAVRFSGQESVAVSASGDLLLRSGGRTIRQQAPIAYQASDGGLEWVRSSYALEGSTVRLRLGPYDRSRPLRVDPLIYLGMIAGAAHDDVVVNASGQAYVTGTALSSTYPTTPGSFQSSDPDPGNTSVDADAYVTKVNAAGTAAIYSTYLGGSTADRGRGIAIDSGGEAFVTGDTISTDFPTTAGLDQSLFQRDAFVTRLNPSGSALVWSTFVGGNSTDEASAIAAEPNGSGAVITGNTLSENWPTGSDSNTGICDFQDGDPDAGGINSFDAHYTALDSTGAISCSTYVGGNGSDFGEDLAYAPGVAIGLVGRTSSTDLPTTSGALQTSKSGGDDAFAFLVTLPAYLTYLGGDEDDHAYGVAVNADKELFATGVTESTGGTGAGDFPLTPGSFDDADPDPDELKPFVTKLIDKDTLGYSTFLGGSPTACTIQTRCEAGTGIAVDSSGAAYVTGNTRSTSFPTTSGALDTTPSGSGDVFLTKLKPDGSGITYGTYLSGGGADEATAVALDSGGAAYVTGETTDGLGQAVTPGSFDAPAGGFLAKITPVPAAIPSCQGKRATRIGTDAADLLIGTNGPDVFAALGGGDRIIGADGNDLVCAGSGGDRVLGGAGRDRLNGEAGKDILGGEAGRDILKGGGGRDRCVGGGGRDRARGCERRRSIR